MTGAFALAAACPVAMAAPVSVPAFDASGTTRVDGGEALDVGGAMVRVHVGAGTGEHGLDRFLGASALVGLGVPIELGFGMPAIRHHPAAADGPVVESGDMVLLLRLAGVPHLEGVALSTAVSVTPAPLPGEDRLPGFEGRIAAGRAIGPLRPSVNGALVANLDGDIEPWVGGAVAVDAPAGTRLTADLQYPLGDDLRYGLAFGVPIAAGAHLLLDGWRQERDELEPVYEASVNLALWTDALGGGLAYRLDRDGDGVPDGADECPNRWGDNPDGCATSNYAFTQCACPLSGRSDLELERMVANLQLAPPGTRYLVSMSVEYTGDADADFAASLQARDGAHRAFQKAGVPSRNIVIVMTDPSRVGSGPRVTIRKVDEEDLDILVGSTEWAEPVYSSSGAAAPASAAPPGGAAAQPGATPTKPTDSGDDDDEP